ncbi:GNAT family N-acetyltransferase [Ornithinimicrobium cerasi]|uniref:GNAT family N-acetyltransferase n=1 Tax=Ornithinimicrobium cerasi TaxID=2248773 RepID=UPI000EFFB190|nr:GNAT family N-acetyltransferase [Ornithinimicrobium cerasi]
MEQHTAPAGTGTAYLWAPIATDQVAAWADLTNHLAAVDGTEEYYREEDLLEELGHDGVDPARDTLAVWDGSQMVGFVQVSVPPTPDNEGHGRGYLSGGVRESHRGRGLGRELLDLMEPRVAELVAERHPGLPGWVRADGGLQGSSASALLARRGYRPVRYYNLLTRPLDRGAEVPQADGVELVSPGDVHEEATRIAHNDAFRDHWGSGPQTAEVWHENWTGRSVRADMSSLALSDEGDVLAYVLCSEWVDRELFVNLVGTVREARGRGLAQAALLRTIALGAGSGAYDRIELVVDSENPNGATRLYEKVGFTHKLQLVAMQRDLPS